MESVLKNMAHRVLNDYCMSNGVNANGTDQKGATVAKSGRGFKYSLVNISNGYAYITVTLYKDRAPSFTLSPEAQEQIKANRVARG